MPGRLSKRDEKKWQKAKRTVRKQKGKKQSKFTDRDWGLTQFIFKKMKKAELHERVLTLVKTANALDAIGEIAVADSIDDILESI